ncbi:E3 ubiquitin-protein ligase [Vitis vinifera]|uniref:E3 ubiquitin-protein ligase n=1 Tax=Vitis vinifera TaxID=29760 RepID=A0A438GZ75_VITVI|nr:E3 ubiquitin-protein ligase [Vitis vinifera]
MASQNNGERRIDIPGVPTDQTSSTISIERTSLPKFFLSIMIYANVIQIVASVVGLSVSKALEHPANKIFAWVVGYAFACAVMLPFLYYRLRNAETWNRRQSKVMEVFWLTMSCFFVVWFVFGSVCFFGVSSSIHDAPILEGLFKALLLSGCTIYAMPGIAIASYCLFFSWLILSLLLLKLREKHRGTSTPDSPPNVLPTYKFKSKENGGGVLLAAGTKKKSASLSGEDVVCCICLGNYADNEELRELPCCSHFFHVECVDKWLKIKARCPLCQSEHVGAGGAAT